MAITVREDFAVLMFKGLKKLFMDRYNELPKQYDQIFNMETSDKAFEVSHGITGFGSVPKLRETEPIRYDSPQMTYPVSYTHEKYALGYMISREAYDDDQYGVLGTKMSPQLAKSMRVTMEQSAADLLNLGFSVSNGPDQLSLFNTAHPLARTGATVSNRGSVGTVLNATNLNNALVAMRRTVDDAGKKVMLRAKYLVIPPELEITAYQLLNSELVPASSNNDANYLKGSVIPIVMDYLTDTDAWFLLADKGEHGLNWYTRQDVEFDRTADFDTEVAKYKVRARWSRGFDDWRGVWGSPGS